MSAPICFIDTETDGVHPGRRIWEVAVIRVEPGQPTQEYSAYVEIDLSTADPAGLRIGRFYDRHPLGRYLTGRGHHPADITLTGPAVRSRAQVAERIAQLTHGAHIVGAVPNFDTELLDDLLRETGLVPAWHYHLIDVETLAVGYLAAHGRRFLPPWNSDNLTLALDLTPASPEERHTALGDAKWAAAIYQRVTQPRPPAVEPHADSYDAPTPTGPEEDA